MAQLVDLQFTKTYASKDNAEKAVAKSFGNNQDLRYIIVPVENRFGVLFIGNSAVQAGVHFHFNVVN